MASYLTMPPDLAAPNLATQPGAVTPREACFAPVVVLGGLLVLDAAIGLGVPLLTFVVRAGAAPPEVVRHLLALTVSLALGGIGIGGGYSPRLLRNRLAQMRACIAGAGAAIAIVAVAARILDNSGAIAWDWALPAALLGLLGLLAGRAAAGAVLAGEPGRRFGLRTVVVGSGPQGTGLMRSLRLSPHPDIRLLGYVDDRRARATTDADSAPCLGSVTELFALIRGGGVDQVIVALPWSAEDRVLDLIRRLAEWPVHIWLAPDLPGTGGIHLMHILAPPLAGWPSLVKRIEDIVVATLALIVFALPMALIALAIRIDSPGPVLFRQYRTGFNNRDFRMLKFRTIHHHLADHAARTQVTRHDPRVTRLGAVLRRTSLDELPQIFNVLRGEMSFVGPRPHAPGTHAGGRPFDQVVAHYAARHRVRPGMTGLAQVRGLRGETETEDKLVRRIDSDLEYIENWSLWLDLVVLARTAATVLGMRNAY
jgi:Undecaprenyl-phosphate glucose phosphotransferase